MTESISPKDRLDPRRYAAIRSPIPLLALFGGVVELILAALVFTIEAAYQPYIIAGAILLPLGWLLVIFNLIARHHEKLYAPRDFAAPEHFLATLSTEARSTLDRGTLGNPMDYAPFRLSQQTAPEDFSQLDDDLTKSHVSDVLTALDGTELLAVHAWHNENDCHLLAFQALSLAIAKGLAASKNYSFAAASLRKLGRLLEAKAYCLLALSIDEKNLDAKYNLALVQKAMGNRQEAILPARDVFRKGAEYHKNRILEEFPELRAGERKQAEQEDSLDEE